MSLPDAIVALLRNDPARRRRLTRRAGVAAARRGLRGRYGFAYQDPDVVVTVDGVEVARYSPWEDGCAHD